eukprot:5656003-Prymnesium_polylepis.1
MTTPPVYEPYTATELGKDDEHHRDHDGEVLVESDDEDDEDDAGGEPGPDEPLRFRFSWRKLWRFAGPGWLMSLGVPRTS